MPNGAGLSCPHNPKSRDRPFRGFLCGTSLHRDSLPGQYELYSPDNGLALAGKWRRPHLFRLTVTGREWALRLLPTSPKDSPQTLQGVLVVVAVSNR